MRRQRSQKKLYTVCAVVTLAVFAAFAARLADWQLIHGKEYRDAARNAVSITESSERIRGEILDSNGSGLVVNETHCRLTVDRSVSNETLTYILDLLAQVGEKWTDELSTNAAVDTKALCRRYGLNGDERRLRELLSVRYGMEKAETESFDLVPRLSRAHAGYLSERMLGLEGAEIKTTLVRRAAQPTLAPHLLGALGAISEEEYEELSGEGYHLSDRIGKFGVERAFESTLRGIPGERQTYKSADGEPVTVTKTEPQPGNTVWLTIDSDLQKIAQQALEENIRDAGNAGGTAGKDCESGAAVMLAVSDFSVLAAASCPGFDLNRYSAYGEDYEKLIRDSRAPLFDRAFSGTFACGSVFKPCVALAALQAGVVSPETEIFCTQLYDRYPSAPVACMHYHGSENLTTALAHSCNYYFAEAGRRLGIEKIDRCAERLGLGELTGVETGESKGSLAGRDSGSWTPGNTIQAAIGQSDNAFTPLQLATCAATIANDGRRLQTHVVSKITDYERTKTIRTHIPTEKATLPVDKKWLHTVQKAMCEVTKDPEGTAYSVFGGYPVTVAAKTGTAENAGSDHATFICYAPAEKPEVAVAVVLEHGARGVFAMNTAKALLDGYFQKNAN